MQPIAQSSLRSVDGSGLKKDEEALIKGLKPISGLVASYNKRIREASEQGQDQSFKRLKQHLPSEWTTSIDIEHRKLEIVGLHLSTNRLSPGTTSQQTAISTIQCDNRIEPGNIAPAKSEIFQCQANNLEFITMASFGGYILDACFSPTGKTLLISGCDSLNDHSPVTCRQGADGNWSEKSRSKVEASEEILFQLNRLENTLLSITPEGHLNVSTLNSYDHWKKTRVLEPPPLEDGDEQVKARFSPLQDKIMSCNPLTGKINVLHVDGNSQWTLLNPLGDIRQVGLTAPEFNATNNYLITYNGTKVTIWGCDDQSNCLENKFEKNYDSSIEDCQMSDDEQHALIFPRGNQVFFLACDVDGHWSQVGEVRHSAQIVNHCNENVCNRICKAYLNNSGQYALTHDLAKKCIISGHDDNGAWVEKREIPSCDLVSFSISGRKVLARLGRGSFKIWGCHSGNRLDKGQPLEHIGSDRACFSPSENLLLSFGNLTNYACIWGDDEDGNLIEKARICHQRGINFARFNGQEDSVLSISRDCTVKVQWLDRDGKWQGQLMVQHQKRIDFADFSISGRLAFTVSMDGTACILGRDDNSEWTLQAITRHDGYVIQGALFNKLDNHFLTFGCSDKDHDKSGFVQFWSIGNDGKWAEKELITLAHPVEIAKFSPDSDHIMIHCQNNSGSATLPRGATALLWKIPASLSA
ncbi:WD40 repeat domain-containing protein [Endozoicomonas sp. ALB115]|uniref:WD40 repeat domain-containing protein n=1 Tax=Endozoicomonas sp. ALB115 TaxID=3403074 RepID=UPI003BB4F340